MKDSLIVILFNMWGFTVTLIDIDMSIKILIASLTVIFTFLKIRNEMLIRKKLKKELKDY